MGFFSFVQAQPFWELFTFRAQRAELHRTHANLKNAECQKISVVFANKCVNLCQCIRRWIELHHTLKICMLKISQIVEPYIILHHNFFLVRRYFLWKSDKYHMIKFRRICEKWESSSKGNDTAGRGNCSLIFEGFDVLLQASIQSAIQDRRTMENTGFGAPFSGAGNTFKPRHILRMFFRRSALSTTFIALVLPLDQNYFLQSWSHCWSGIPGKMGANRSSVSSHVKQTSSMSPETSLST